MYGVFLPILIPIAGFGIFNLYAVERISLAYYARQPPLYDEKLNKRVLDLLRFAPIFMFAFGYWALGNRQMFFGEAPQIEYAADNIDPDHHLFYFLRDDRGAYYYVNYQDFMGGAACLFFCITVLHKLFDKCLRKCKIIRKLSLSEHVANQLAESLFEEHDVDKNGAISKAEAKKFFQEEFVTKGNKFLIFSQEKFDEYFEKE